MKIKYMLQDVHGTTILFLSLYDTCVCNQYFHKMFERIDVRLLDSGMSKVATIPAVDRLRANSHTTKKNDLAAKPKEDGSKQK